MDPETLRILRMLTASERKLYRALGGTLPRCPPAVGEWYRARSVAEIDRDAQKKRAIYEATYLAKWGLVDRRHVRRHRMPRRRARFVEKAA